MLHRPPVPPCSATTPATSYRLSGTEAVIVVIIILVAAYMTLAGLPMRRSLELTAGAVAIAFTALIAFRAPTSPIRHAAHILVATATLQSR